MLAGVDLVDQMLLGNHLAGQFLPIGVVDGQVGLREAALTQFPVLHKVFAVDNLHSLHASPASVLLLLLLVPNHALSR